MKQITFQGINSSPCFTEDGVKFLYVSQQRPSHQQTQVYEFDLSSTKEKRLTYQDGLISNPLSIGKDILAYSSTTDEIKERPLRLKENMLAKETSQSKQIPSEIYMSDRFGENITRITSHPGLDGLISFKKSYPQKLFFSRYNKGSSELWEESLATKKGKALTL